MRDAFPPRGSTGSRPSGSPPSQSWGHPWQLDPGTWHWRPGMFLLGEWNDDRGSRQMIGLDDDRHIVTAAGSRGGKTRTSIKPNLDRYPGSMIIIDPKGELYRKTHKAREKFGKVFKLDGFGVTGGLSHSFNPLSELAEQSRPDPVVAADAAQLADALITQTGGDTHWTDSAKNLLLGIILYLIATKTSPPTLRDVRALLNADLARLEELFTRMSASRAFGGIVANAGSSFLGKLAGSEKELQGILSTAQEQTARIDDLVGIMDRSDFQLADLKREVVTIYLILPGMRMGTHFRWMRMMIQLALAAMELEPYRKGSLPVWFVLEEFATLGHMRSIETAAGFMAGFGVRLWTVLQDLSQLKAIYPNSWETFLGNAGIFQAYANTDLTTCEYISKRLGEASIIEVEQQPVNSGMLSKGDIGRRERSRSVPLLAPYEVGRYFARTTGRALVLSPERPPVYVNRFKPEDEGVSQ